jgi:ferric-dicitrate binding protein FerR (iron transport regulator)
MDVEEHIISLERVALDGWITADPDHSHALVVHSASTCRASGGNLSRWRFEEKAPIEPAPPNKRGSRRRRAGHVFWGWAGLRVRTALLTLKSLV